MAENIPPDDDDTSQTATWVTGQLGKDILQDEDNYTYHQYSRGYKNRAIVKNFFGTCRFFTVV
jgi:hypothetical protein